MTDTCNCPRALNTGCHDFAGVISSQPQCQIIPDGSRVTNPYYDEINNITYYSYQFLINCQNPSSTINPGNLISFGVIICETIPLASVLNVSERLDGCPDFQDVPFDFNEIQLPEPGFRFLRVLVNQDVIPGSAAMYRIALSGNYPAVRPPGSGNEITVRTTQFVGVTGSLPYTFPGCPAVPRLTLTKSCEAVIENNLATLNYRVVVANTGETDLPDVEYNDVLNYDGNNVTFGQIEITPPDINVNTTVPGLVQFTGNLGEITIGNSVEVLYTIPIQAFAAPNRYSFSNMATARSGVTEGVAECEVSVDVVELQTENCCTIGDNNTAAFIACIINVLNSPSTAITMRELISIPSNVVVQFNSFGNCTATLPTGEPVPINSDITNTVITVTCDASVPLNATVEFPVNFTIISLDSFANNEYILSSRIDSVELQNPDQQILLRVSPLPNTQTININTILRCES